MRQYLAHGYWWHRVIGEVFQWQYGYFNNPFELEAEITGAALATHVLRRPVRPDLRYGNPTYR